jgi:hypothetical protein
MSKSREKMLSNIINKRKGMVEKALLAVVDALGVFATAVLSAHDYRELEKKLDEILDMEIDFENIFQAFTDQLKKRFSTPFYWDDLYSIGVCLRNIFNLLVMYCNKSLIYKSDVSYRGILNVQLELFENIKSFFREYLENRKYTWELLKNNSHQLKSYLHVYLEIINSRMRENPSSTCFYEIRALLERIKSENDSIHNLMNKIMIGID